MKKWRGFCLVVCICTICAGCNKSAVDVKEKAGKK